jgi:hypothetical protein
MTISQNKLIEREEILSHIIKQRLFIFYFCKILLEFDIDLKALEIISKNFGDSNAMKKCHKKSTEKIHISS